MRKIISNIAAVATLSLAIVPVLGLTQAANAAEMAVRVSYADLNLASPQQAAVFKARVAAAGEKVCRDKQLTGELYTTMGGCIAAAHRQAAQQLPDTQRQALAYAAAAPSIEVAAK